ncbi:MAG: ABC transporter ATP-binding protein [Crocinitomicaceae bacterium]|nr:ABC transporter ATP-binding protein [Crocinitomicaceae bacterium]
MLELQNVSLKFNEKVILEDISCSIGAGEIVGIIGKSGMGKTSLLKVMSAHLEVNSGKVIYAGKALIGPNEKLITGYEDLQIVNQDFALDLYHTVEENVREKVLHLPKKEQLILIDEVLSLVELDHLRLQKAHLLSGGEQQRLALARALACEPTFIFLDEPFVHLDQALRFRIMNYLKRLNEVRNIAIVLVSHDGSELMGLVNRLLHLQNGKIVRDDHPHNLFYQPVSVEQAELLGTINQLEIKGDEILFRPNEYSLDSGSIKIEVGFKRSLNTGLLVLNYFVTPNGTNIVLSSKHELKSVDHFYIQKRDEHQS